MAENTPEPCTAPPAPDHGVPVPLVPPSPPPPTAPAAAPAPPPLLAAVWASLTGRAAKVAFAAVTIAVLTFYFKDQRLAREAAEQPAAKGEPPAALRQQPDQPPEGWEQMSDAELDKLGFKRITRAEFEKLILPDAVVVTKGRHDTPGYRVAYVENDYAFLEDLGNAGTYLARPVATLERKRIPDPMPPPAELPGPHVRPRPKTDGP